MLSSDHVFMAEHFSVAEADRNAWLHFNTH